MCHKIQTERMLMSSLSSYADTLSFTNSIVDHLNKLWVYRGTLWLWVIIEK